MPDPPALKVVADIRTSAPMLVGLFVSVLAVDGVVVMSVQEMT
jgi:hypothetical protein